MIANVRQLSGRSYNVSGFETHQTRGCRTKVN